MKVICAQNKGDLAKLRAGTAGVMLFARSDQPEIGSIGASVKESVERHKCAPDARAWDFVALALSVYAADQLVSRGESSDGWTRDIELHVAVNEPDFWNGQQGTINDALRFLTTDRWVVTFTGNPTKLAVPKKAFKFAETSISLLSGGMDSLIGAVDLAAQKEKALLVSQVANGDRDRQKEFATALGLTHLQLTHGADLPGDNEPSTRSRSIVFIAYGVMAATLLDSYGAKGAILRTPENGFMSVNPPLTDARLGGLSTRTTHPVFIHHIQTILDAAGLRIELKNPYQFKTKGEMIKDCLNQDFIKANAHKSTSCGRFVRTQYRHCGRCVPCLVRRAAFANAGLRDATDYKYDSLKKDDADHAKFDDVRSAAMAVAIVESDGIGPWLGASLMAKCIEDPVPYKDVVGRGIKELGAFLKAAGVK